MTSENAPNTSELMLLIPRLAKQVLRRSNPELLGMHLRLLLAISYLNDRDGAPQQGLDDVLCMDGRNVVLLLNELEDLGHVVRRRDPADRRRHRVYLTDSGRQALHRAAGVQQEIQEDVLRALSADERVTLWQLVTRALHGAEPHDDASDRATPAASAPVSTA